MRPEARSKRQWVRYHPATMSAQPVASRQMHSTAEVLRAGAVRVLDAALAIVQERRGIDFSGYRRGTLERRLVNRMVAARASTADEYLSMLREADGEVDRLAANLTIKVSRFYRNAAAYDSLATSALPLLRQTFPGQPLRAWSAGCAGGEEAYTLSMLLDGPGDVVYATDIDESALALARRAHYAFAALVEVPPAMQASLVGTAPEADVFTVSAAVRERVEFARHDLATAHCAPGPARYHLVCCRNVLIYFAPELQRRAMHLLVESLLPDGILFLGEAEWPGFVSSSLQVLDPKHRLFRRLHGAEAQP